MGTLNTMFGPMVNVAVVGVDAEGTGIVVHVTLGTDEIRSPASKLLVLTVSVAVVAPVLVKGRY